VPFRISQVLKSPRGWPLFNGLSEGTRGVRVVPGSVGVRALLEGLEWCGKDGTKNRQKNQQKGKHIPKA
jgi:hypothetical protein